MAVRAKPSAEAAAWRQFIRMARQCREADGDDELRALLIVRVRAAFETWATEAAGAGKVK
jgi:hypothetical protein